jgi:thiamine pyrophosphate-dependent acetolactate synthase large subunit-like protein
MTGGEFLLQTLRDQGLDHVFLVPGGPIDPRSISLRQRWAATIPSIGG